MKKSKSKSPFTLVTASFFLLFLNICSSHVDMRITNKQKKFFKKPIFRDILIFIICFTASENIYISILITILYIIIFDNILNEKTRIGKKLNII